mmetsp:Transcript_110622/g.308165  ORF Transcript_110622/g.308165 Transcript_110622/m.308165 type:complete len:248 (-) Transcript_110622:191-934(-)
MILATLAPRSSTHIAATEAALATGKVVAVAIRAARATGTHADVPAACGARAAKKLCPVVVRALYALRHLVGAECGRGHGILVASTVCATFTTRCGASVPTTGVVLCARKAVAQSVLATRAARCDAYVATAGGPWATHEGLPLRVRALNTVVNVGRASCASCHRVQITQSVLATLIARSCASVAATRAAGTAGEIVAMGVLAASATWGDAHVTAACGSWRALEVQPAIVLADLGTRLVGKRLEWDGHH